MPILFFIRFVHSVLLLNAYCFLFICLALLFFYHFKLLTVKKLLLLFCLSAAAFVSYAGEISTKADNPKVTIHNTVNSTVLQECATASTSYQGVTIVCYRCAETMGGPNGAEAKAADCLMDAMMEMQP